MVIDVNDTTRAGRTADSEEAPADPWAWLNAIQAMVVVLDPAGRIRFCNRACESFSAPAAANDDGTRFFWDYLAAPDEAEAAKAVFRDARAETFPASISNHWSSAEGRRRLIEWSTRAVRDRQGRLEFVVCTGTDIYGSRHLAETESRYRAVVDSQGELVSRYLADTTLTFVNEAYCRYYGEARSAVLGRRFINHVAEEDRAAVERHIAALTPERPFATIEHRLVTADGSVRWQQWTDRAVIGPDGRIVEYQAVGRDITERKEIEDALRESTARFKAIMDNAPVEIVLKDAAGRIVETNRLYQTLQEKTAEELRGKRPENVFPDESLARSIREHDLEVLNTGRTTERHHEVCHEGSAHTYHTIKFPIRDPQGRITGLGAIIADVTEKRQAEAALRESESRYRAVVEDQTELICRFLPDGTLTFVNDAYCRYFGKTEAELVGRTFMPMIPDEDQETVKAAFGSLGPENPVITYEHRVIAPDGDVRWQQWTDRLVVDGAGAPVGYQAVGRDITDLKRAEQAVLEREQRLRTIADALPVLIAYVDRKERFRFVNRTGEKWYAKPRSRIVGSTARAMLGDNPYRVVQPKICAALGGKEVDANAKITYPDGVTRLLHVNYIPDTREDGSVEGFFALVEDITEREQAKQNELEHRAELANVLRLSSLGELASGIAHELNQPLTAAMNYIEVARRRLRLETPDMERVQDLLDKSAAQASRAGRIIRDLRELVETGKAERSRCDLNELVREACNLGMVDSITSNIRLDLDLAADLPRVLANKTQIQQVMLNLGRNSIEAMAHSHDRVLSIATGRSGNGQVAVTISDTGVGLAEEVRRHLFLPFVTTKDDGMGIGLSVCKSIIDAHGGQLWAENNPGAGATFHFTLPAEKQTGSRHDR